MDVSEVRFGDDTVVAGELRQPFDELAREAYVARVQLWSDGFYTTPKLHWDQSKLQGRPFYYFAYGAACSEVLVDTLTGEWRLLRADVLHDAGRSLNPALDIGPVEARLHPGMGWLTTEELWWNQNGKLMTHAPSTYKIPTVNDCPETFNVRLFQNRNVEDSIHRSRLSASRRCCCRSRSSSPSATPWRRGDYRINPPLTAPATGEAILDAADAVREAVAAQGNDGSRG